MAYKLPRVAWGHYEDDPMVIIHGHGFIKAWIVRDFGHAKTWSECSPASASHEGSVFPKAEFDRRYPHLPPLPEEVRRHLSTLSHSDPNRERAPE